MKPLALHALFAVTLFSIGMAAGNWVRSEMHFQQHLAASQDAASDADESFGSEHAVLPPSDRTRAPQVSSEADSNPESVFLAGLSKVVTDDMSDPPQSNPGAEAEPGTAPSYSSAESFATSPNIADGRPASGRAEAMKLMAYYFPEATTAECETWAEEFSGFGAEDLAFLLEQKKAAGLVPGQSALSAGLMDHFGSLIRSEHNQSGSAASNQNATNIEQAGHTSSGEFGNEVCHGDACGSSQRHSNAIQAANRQIKSAELAQAIQSVQQNLIGQSVPGYRAAQVIFTGLMTTNLPVNSHAGSGVSAEKSCCTPVSHVAGDSCCSSSAGGLQTHAVRRFECGKLLLTGNALHVALPSDSSLMFALPDGTYTRRGDFCAVDHQLRLPTGQVICSPEKSAELSGISTGGEVLCTAADGSTVIAGQLKVVEFQSLDSLTTTDGVIFRLTDEASQTPARQPRELATQEIQLTVKNLEQSNSDAQSEWESLDHFRRLDREILVRQDAP
jgi:flagellar basal body rod protein FlgG